MFHILLSNPDTSGGGSFYNYCGSYGTIEKAQEWIANELQENEARQYIKGWEPHFIIAKTVA